jgi:hypothetical protein
MAEIRHIKVLHHLENNLCDVHPCFGTSSNPLGLTYNLRPEATNKNFGKIGTNEFQYLRRVAA